MKYYLNGIKIGVEKQIHQAIINRASANLSVEIINGGENARKCEAGGGNVATKSSARRAALHR